MGFVKNPTENIFLWPQKEKFKMKVTAEFSRHTGLLHVQRKAGSFIWGVLKLRYNVMHKVRSFDFFCQVDTKPDDQSSEKVTRMLIILNICSVVDVYNPLW